MKADEVILNYLKPYTTQRGKLQKYLIQVTDMFGVLSIEVDDETAFNGKDHEYIMKYLRTHGFKYVMGRYCRLKTKY